jgi:peptidoglycan/LPS O-acetylase OafA/YrhL
MCAAGASGGPGKIPSLDGLRAISIGLVLVSHVVGTRHLPEVPALAPFGLLGVRVFFVISGFLITTLLLGEARRHGTISLPRFYLRRTFRIFPAFYAYLAVVGVLVAVGAVELARHDLLAALTYTMNFHWDRARVLGHLWSLSVEEQFYLLWPAAMLWLRPRRAILAAAVIVALAPVCRLATWFLAPAWRVGISEAVPTVADAIAIGCVLAGLRPWLDRQAGYLRWLRSPGFVVVPVVAVVASQLGDHALIDFAVLQTLTNVAIALIVDRVVRFPDDAVGRLLNARPVAYVGLLSYSLYLWQQLFLNPHSDAPWCAFPLNVGLLAVAAPLSYYVVERPCLRARARLEAWLDRP